MTTPPTGPTNQIPISPALAAIANSAIQNNPAAVQAIAQQLGLTPAAMQSLQSQLQAGTVSSGQLQSLSSQLGSLNLSPAQLQGIATSMGVSSQQFQQIQNYINGGRGVVAGAQPGQPLPPGQVPQAGSTPTPGQNPLQPQNAPGAPPVMAGQPAATGPSSAIETQFQQLSNPGQIPAAPSTTGLAQFGYSYFAAQVSTFAPVGNVPVGDDYIVGPGDNLNILYWGTLNQTLALTVDRDGSVPMPNIGGVIVGGLTFGQAKKLLEGKVKQITGVQAQVTMGQLRTIQVFVVGEVSQPGAYTISALSRVSNALVAAGGVAKTGSLRNVEVRRGNQTVKRIDFYDVLLHGDNSPDVRLEEGDVIFVPVIGRVVAVAGDVKRPAIYELAKKSEDLAGTIQLAGGVTAFGYLERLQVQRVENHEKMVAVDIHLDQLKSKSIEVLDGDVVQIFPVLPIRLNTVTLAGNVHRPGIYEFKPGMRISDLVKEGEGILPHTYFKYALIKRLEGPQRYIHYLTVELGDALASTPQRRSTADTPLTPMDELDVYSLDDLRQTPNATVAGEVRVPGTYMLSERMKVSDLIYMAGGLNDDAYKERAQLVRLDIVNGQTVRHTFDVDVNEVLKNGKGDLVLKTNDQLYVRAALDWTIPPRQVAATGEVRNPGSFNYYDGMRVSDLVALAGGLKDNAYREKIQLARTEVLDGNKTRHSYIDIDLREALEPGNPADLALYKNDQIFVPAAANYHLPYVVTVSGQVVRPGPYVIRQGERLTSVLSRAGGFLPNAFPQGLVFIRLDVKAAEQQRLTEAQQRLTQGLAQYALVSPLMSSGKSQDSGATASGYAALQNLLTQAQSQQAEGRVVVRMKELDRLAESTQDIALEDGDAIAVPERPSSVNVLGQVNQPTSIVRQVSYTVNDYIAQAGGINPYGDKKNIMVVKADGSVITEAGLSRQNTFPFYATLSGGLMGLHLDVGDTVYVPEDIADYINLQYAIDISTIFANAAQTLAVIGILGSQL